jgi:hypothetical protein
MSSWVIAKYDRAGRLVGLRTYHGSEKTVVYSIKSRADMVAVRQNRNDPDHSYVVEDASAHTIIR